LRRNYVVDDDASVREALAGLVASAGLTAKTAASGQEFLVMVRPDFPSCLVLDVELPGLSGIELQQKLIRSGIHIPIVFLTGHGSIPMTTQAVKAGAADSRAAFVSTGPMESGIHVRTTYASELDFASCIATGLKQIGGLEAIFNDPEPPMRGAAIAGGGQGFPAGVPFVTVMIGVKPLPLLTNRSNVSSNQQANR